MRSGLAVQNEWTSSIGQLFRQAMPRVCGDCMRMCRVAALPGPDPGRWPGSVARSAWPCWKRASASPRRSSRWQRPVMHCCSGDQQSMKPVFRQLRRGHYRVEGEIDLHGLTAAMVVPALRSFLADCLHHDARGGARYPRQGTSFRQPGPGVEAGGQRISAPGWQRCWPLPARGKWMAAPAPSWCCWHASPVRGASASDQSAPGNQHHGLRSQAFRTSHEAESLGGGLP